MIRHIGLHGADDTYVINALGDVRKKFTHLDAAPSVFLKLERRLKRRAGAAFGGEIINRQWFAVELGEDRLGIKRVHVRRTAVGKDVDDALGLGGKMRSMRGERAIAGDLLPQRTRTQKLRPE